ncbi:MAG: KamA family radical SAM protein [Candidatus Omnitrophica bacterium]|nr:KamA family radical SAM protein [Candidatus Omnitrophota bacterium]
MKQWEKTVKDSIITSEALKETPGVDKKKIDAVVKKYPMRINGYYKGLIKKRGDAIWKQCMPDIQEINQRIGRKDPLLEKKYSPIDGLVHRYKDRVLLTVSDMCAVYCRFCTRKRHMGMEEEILKEKNIQKAFNYIKTHKSIRDVIISGGDPLMLDDLQVKYLLKNIRNIEHVEIIRIHSRTPCVLPQRITPELCKMLSKYSPLYFNTHFNHFQEITKESRKACDLLADSGIVLGNQSVLLAGVNDDAKVLKELYERLLTMRVRPYYLYVPDAVKGTYHFRVSIAKACSIMKKLIGNTSGLAVPHLIIDLKGGGGKTPLLPKYIIKHEGRKYVFKNFEGNKYYYADI